MENWKVKSLEALKQSWRILLKKFLLKDSWEILQGFFKDSSRILQGSRRLMCNWLGADREWNIKSGWLPRWNDRLCLGDGAGAEMAARRLWHPQQGQRQSNRTNGRQAQKEIAGRFHLRSQRHGRRADGSYIETALPRRFGELRSNQSTNPFTPTDLFYDFNTKGLVSFSGADRIGTTALFQVQSTYCAFIQFISTLHFTWFIRLSSESLPLDSYYRSYRISFSCYLVSYWSFEMIGYWSFINQLELALSLNSIQNFLIRTEHSNS